MHKELWPRTHGNVFLRFCIVSSNELVVLDSLENSKQYKNAEKRFRVYGPGPVKSAPPRDSWKVRPEPNREFGKEDGNFKEHVLTLNNNIFHLNYREW